MIVKKRMTSLKTTQTCTVETIKKTTLASNRMCLMKLEIFLNICSFRSWASPDQRTRMNSYKILILSRFTHWLIYIYIQGCELLICNIWFVDKRIKETEQEYYWGIVRCTSSFHNCDSATRVGPYCPLLSVGLH